MYVLWSRRRAAVAAAIAVVTAVAPAAAAANVQLTGAHRGASVVAARHIRHAPSLRTHRHATHRRYGRHETTLTRHVVSRGTYRVAITVATRARRAGTVRLLVGSSALNVRVGGSQRLHRLALKVFIRGRTLTIRARSVHFRPGVRVKLHRVRRTVRTVAPPVAQTPPSPQTTSSGSLEPTGAPGAGSWHVIFDDEFNAGALDKSKWSVGWFGSGVTAGVNSAETDCYDPGQVSVPGGTLDLTVTAKQETCGGQSQPYAAGIVTTNGKFSFTYGFYEVRAWLPASGSQIANWPAIWADGQSWPNDGELDTFEGLGGLPCWHFHDPSGGPGDCASGGYAAGWHTFGADWERGIVTYYYDGHAVGSITSGITSAPMFLILDNATSKGSPTVAPATMRVDYVRVWQH